MNIERKNFLVAKCVVEKEDETIQYKIFVDIDFYTKEIIYKACTHNWKNGNWNTLFAESSNIDECINEIERAVDKFHKDAKSIEWVECKSDADDI
jgi:hypothetical protein